MDRIKFLTNTYELPVWLRHISRFTFYCFWRFTGPSVKQLGTLWLNSACCSFKVRLGSPHVYASKSTFAEIKILSWFLLEVIFAFYSCLSKSGAMQLLSILLEWGREKVVFWQLPRVPQTGSKLSLCATVKVEALCSLPLFSVLQNVLSACKTKSVVLLCCFHSKRDVCSISWFGVCYFSSSKQWPVLTPILSSLW